MSKYILCFWLILNQRDLFTQPDLMIELIELTFENLVLSVKFTLDYSSNLQR